MNTRLACRKVTQQLLLTSSLHLGPLCPAIGHGFCAGNVLVGFRSGQGKEGARQNMVKPVLSCQCWALSGGQKGQMLFLWLLRIIWERREGTSTQLSRVITLFGEVGDGSLVALLYYIRRFGSLRIMLKLRRVQQLFSNVMQAITALHSIKARSSDFIEELKVVTL